MLDKFDRSIDRTLPMDWVQQVQSHPHTAAMIEIGDNNQTEYNEKNLPTTHLSTKTR